MDIELSLLVVIKIINATAINMIGTWNEKKTKMEKCKFRKAFKRREVYV